MPVTEAVTLTASALVPVVYVVEAKPPESVVAMAGATAPPAPLSEKVTETPATGLPFPSLTLTLRGAPRLVTTGADWLFPEAMAIDAGAFPVAVTVKVALA